MTEFPRALRRWRRELGIFPDDLAPALGGFLARLAPVFDGASQDDAGAAGEFDGYDGITRRGSYERLLTSEWAIRETAPLEFLRRAASGEHLFLNVRRKTPASARGTVVLFDAGPDQVGAPRIVQMAVLLLLAERAARRSEGFGWQLLHHRGESLFTGVNAESVRAFLAARVALRLGEDAVNDWRTRHRSETLWVVGPPRLMRGVGADVSVVEIAERVEAEGAPVDVRVAPATRKGRTVTLEAPQGRVATRLIRDPFEPLIPAIRGDALPRADANLVMNPQGSRLFYRDDSGALVSMTVPATRRLTTMKRVVFALPPNATEYIGVGRAAKKVIALAVAPGSLGLASSEPLERGGERLQSCNWPGAVSGGPLRPLITFPGTFQVVFADASNLLWRADFKKDHVELLARGVKEIVPFKEGGGLVAVDDDSQATKLPRSVLHVTHNIAKPVYETERAWGRVYLRLDAEQPSYVLGVEVAPASFRIEWHRVGALEVDDARVRSINLSVLPGCRVVGIDRIGGSAALGLYCLAGDDHQLIVTARTRSQDLLTTQAKIERVALAPSRGLLAYTTEDGELGFVERSGRILWRGRMEPAA